ncbi:MAG TPA: helix-turn-helix domain-containing protein [Phycisphaerae bacterium]|nr:helix-turn-helix domain-containing protein [Phycisphaerae bacterium]
MRIDSEKPSDASPHYLKSVNRAIDHIVRNLDQPLNLDAVAEVACFSPFHFHRIFRALMGETLNQFVRRLRLERALWMLAHQGPRSLTEISLACGFTSLSDFSRRFKEKYGVPPSEFKLDQFRQDRRDELDAALCEHDSNHHLFALPDDVKADNFDLTLRQLPARRVAYLRVLDPFRIGIVTGAAERFVAWAEQRGLADGQWLGYMWDDPVIVEFKDCRYDVGLEVENVEPEGEIGVIEFPPMTVAQIEIRGPIQNEMRAMDWLFKCWLPNSRYVPDDHPFFEAWIGRPFAHGIEHFELYVQIPVKRAR